MNLQIALFRDERVSREIPKFIGRIKSRACSVDSNYLHLIPNITNKDIRSLVDKPKRYYNALGVEYDSHYLVEYYGLTPTSRNYSIEVDISNRLDLVLHQLCGCDINSVRAVPRYDIISKALLTLDVTNLDISLGELLGLDDKLDKYILSFADQGGMEFCMELLSSSILTKAMDIAKYIAFYLQVNLDGIVVRSLGKGKVLMSSYTDIGLDSIDILLDDSKIEVQVNCLNCKEIIGG